MIVHYADAIIACGMQEGDEFQVLADEEVILTVSEDGSHPVEIHSKRVSIVRVSGDTPIDVFVEGPYAARSTQ